MTTPTVSPAGESPQGGSPVETKRSRRIYILWGVVLFLLLALGAFCWAVVVPVVEVQGVLNESSPYQGPPRPLPQWPPKDAIESEAERRKNVAKLGDPASAVRKLTLYLRVPQWALSCISKAPEYDRARASTLRMEANIIVSEQWLDERHPGWRKERPAVESSPPASGDVR